jgi:hypothetical protein
LKTLLQLRDHVKADLDLEDEDFISDSDINTWLNEGITSAEQQIHTLYEDYFLAQDTVTLSSGQNLYDYPSDIYANKIRKMIFRDGVSNSTSTHLVRRVRDLLLASERDYFGTNTTNAILQWAPINDSTNGRKIRLFPQSARGGFLDIWYIRNAKVLVADTDVCDIDEFEKYVVQYAKTQAFLKDADPRADDSVILQQKYESDMILTLSDMTPDRDDELDMDLSHYEDMNGYGGYFGEDC